ncbi:NmrA/HSCARG family protein [Nocardia sp. NBC_00565]|uniref:NmrA/HSCARG family protein n=1 Tax=Nocardia sp. NBC_00565 TaxID=2975993 RepID=UPI002E805D3C|nr:NmrA/HSCARG family protein [Nocardia sp. NBC_00565]WUC06597.1 NmrA/HSCARG family protein [Nocardia sp. NBC_00565]
MTTSEPVLVTGATGKQGSAVARALLSEGTPVRALVRDPHSARASAIETLGATLVTGDLNDKGSLIAAASGARAVFSIQTPDPADPGSDSEMLQGKNLVEAARTAGVAQFVHSSVAGAGEFHRNAPGWKEGRWNRHFWESKAYTQDLVRDTGFTYWTLLKPSYFMENFLRPLAIDANRLVSVIAPSTVVSLVAVQDIASAAAAAMNDPAKFNKVELELASDELTWPEIAAILSEVLGAKIDAPSLSPEEAVAAGLTAGAVNSQQRLNEVDSPARPEYAHNLGLTTTGFRTWATENMHPSA